MQEKQKLIGHISGIGADDAFIFVKLWNCSIIERESMGLPISSTSSYTTNTSYPDTLAGLLAMTIKHASTSILVTSLTTALAFYTSYLSSITAIRCFGYVQLLRTLISKILNSKL